VQQQASGVVGIITGIWIFVGNLALFPVVKNFENQLRFDEVTAVSRWFGFWPRNVVKRGICYLSVCLSVCPPVCPSHSWLTPKRLQISKYALHHTIERRL